MMKIAMLQTASVPLDYAENLHQLEQAMQQAKTQEANLLITPEMFLSGYVLKEQTRHMAETLPLAQVQQLAATYQLALIVGAPRMHGQGVMNSTYFIDDQGELLNVYDKTHLFGEIDRQQFIAGQTPVVMTTYHNIKIAMLICYDVEFPETVRAAAQAGAHLVAVATAQMQPFSFVNKHLIATRAWENQVYVAYVNQIGHEEPFEYVGLTTLAAPNGDVIAQASETQATLLFAQVSAEQVQHAQKNNPYLHDLRQDLFTDSAKLA